MLGLIYFPSGTNLLWMLLENESIISFEIRMTRIKISVARASNMIHTESQQKKISSALNFIHSFLPVISTSQQCMQV